MIDLTTTQWWLQWWLPLVAVIVFVMSICFLEARQRANDGSRTHVASQKANDDSRISDRLHRENIGLLGHDDEETLEELLQLIGSKLEKNTFPVQVSCVRDNITDDMTIQEECEFRDKYKAGVVSYPVNVVRLAHAELEKAGYYVYYRNVESGENIDKWHPRANMLIYKPMFEHDRYQFQSNAISANDTSFFYKID